MRRQTPRRASPTPSVRSRASTRPRAGARCAPSWPAGSRTRSPTASRASSPPSGPATRRRSKASSRPSPALANARDEEGSTPLTAAVDAHRAALIPLLLRHGGDPHLVYAHSAHTPLSWAVVIEAHDCARALMAGGVEPDLYAPPAWATWTGSGPSSARTGGSERGPRSPAARATPPTARACRAAGDRGRDRGRRALRGRPRRPGGGGPRAARPRARSVVPRLRGRDLAALGLLRGRAGGGGPPAGGGRGPRAP